MGGRIFLIKTFLRFFVKKVKRKRSSFVNYKDGINRSNWINFQSSKMAKIDYLNAQKEECCRKVPSDSKKKCTLHIQSKRIPAFKGHKLKEKVFIQLIYLSFLLTPIHIKLNEHLNYNKLSIDCLFPAITTPLVTWITPIMVMTFFVFGPTTWTRHTSQFCICQYFFKRDFLHQHFFRSRNHNHKFLTHSSRALFNWLPTK